MPVEPVGADVVGRDQVPDAVRAVERRADALGLGSGCPALAARLGLQVQRPELVEADHDRLTSLRLRVEFDDPVALGSKSGSLERFQVLTA